MQRAVAPNLDGVCLRVHNRPRDQQRDIQKTRSNEKSSLEVQRHIHQSDHHRHLDERTDHGSECRAAVDTEYRHSHGNRQFEVVAGGGESERRGLGIIRAGSASHLFLEEVVKKFMDAEILSAVYFFVTNLQAPLLALAAGGFLYVALVDLLPELHKQ
jgi:hypothetical protein